MKKPKNDNFLRFFISEPRCVKLMPYARQHKALIETVPKDMKKPKYIIFGYDRQRCVQIVSFYLESMLIYDGQSGFRKRKYTTGEWL